jgi:hypothetical protein
MLADKGCIDKKTVLSLILCVSKAGVYLGMT